MCLAVPGKVVDLFETNGIQMGKMDFDGITKNICLAYIPDIQIGGNRNQQQIVNNLLQNKVFVLRRMPERGKIADNRVVSGNDRRSQQQHRQRGQKQMNNRSQIFADDKLGFGFFARSDFNFFRFFCHIEKNQN